MKMNTSVPRSMLFLTLITTLVMVPTLNTTHDYGIKDGVVESAIELFLRRQSIEYDKVNVHYAYLMDDGCLDVLASLSNTETKQLEYIEVVLQGAAIKTFKILTRQKVSEQTRLNPTYLRLQNVTYPVTLSTSMRAFELKLAAFSVVNVEVEAWMRAYGEDYPTGADLWEIWAWGLFSVNPKVEITKVIDQSYAQIILPMGLGWDYQNFKSEINPKAFPTKSARVSASADFVNGIPTPWGPIVIQRMRAWAWVEVSIIEEEPGYKVAGNAFPKGGSIWGSGNGKAGWRVR